MPELEDFRPPYELGATGCFVLGTWHRDGRWMDARLGAGLVLRYDRPPPEHPVAYSEVIAAYAVRDDGRWGALPFDLVLDDAFNVEAGVRHYNLPKRLDRSLRIEIARDTRGAPCGMTAEGADLTFQASFGRTGGMLSAALASVVGFATARSPVIGAHGDDVRIGAMIQLRPDARTARAADVARFTIGDHTLRPRFARFWGAIDVTLGAPRSLPGAR